MVTICTRINLSEGKELINYITNTFNCFIEIINKFDNQEIYIKCKVENFVAIENLLSVLVS